MPVALLLLLKTLALTAGTPIASYYLTELGKRALGATGAKSVLLNAAAAAGTAALLTVSGANPLPGGQPGTVAFAPTAPESPVQAVPASPPLPLDPSTTATLGAAAIAMLGSGAGYQYWKARAAA